MTKNNNVPQIRFKGFTDTWEQRKLEEICEQVKETVDPQLTPDTKFYEYSMPAFDDNSRADIVSGYDMNSIRKVINAPCLLINKLNVRKKRIWLVEKPEKNAVCSAEFVPVTSDVSDLSFLKYTTLKDDFTAYLEDCSSGSSNSQKRVTPDVIMKATIQIPTIAEQSIIGTFFSNLDSIITLHQRKCETLKKLKKSMLQKMFPKNGKSVPEIRFAGFTDAWEQRELSDIYASIGNAFVGTATPYYVSDGHFYLESNNVKDGQINHNTEIFINDEFYEKQKDKWLHTGDMVMVQSGHVGHAAVIPEELDNSAAHALIMFRNPKVKINPYFLNYQYQTIKAKKKIENITTGNTIKHILASDMQNFVVDVPNFDEQEKIGQYFTNLDNLITLHQRKLETLKKLKKSMLQKMFI